MSKQFQTDVKIKRFSIDELEFASYNPRAISDDARAGLAESIERFGLLELPVVNVHGGKKRVVGGHQKLRQLQTAKFKEVDCIVVRFDDTAEMAANVALNNTAIRGIHDPAKIVELESLKKLLPKPNFMRFDAALQKLREQAARARAATGPKADDEGTETDEAIDSQLGKTYKLGEHRVFCGDFETGAAKLFPKHYANVAIADPPYNVSYRGGKFFRKDKLREAIEGDEQETEDWFKFVDRLTSTLLDSVSGGAYVFMSAKELHTLQHAWERHKGVVHRWLVIAKDAHTLSPGDYQSQYELCLLGSRADAELVMAEPRSNVLSIARPGKNALHPAQKPVELIRQLVADSTEVEEVIFDPFAGSGTVLAVAQEMARVCYACELDPAYVDVIRKRWAEQVHKPGCDWKSLTPVFNETT